MPIAIRPLTPNEYIDTVHIYLECMRADYTFFPREYLDSLRIESELAEFESWINEDGVQAMVFGAFQDDRMTGYIAVSSNSGEPAGYDGEVNNLFVRPGCRNQGIGLALLRAGLEHLRGLGHQSVIIYNYHPSQSNAYYRHLGGEVVYRTVQCPGGQETQVDVFAWEIDKFQAILHERMEKYPALRV